MTPTTHPELELGLDTAPVQENGGIVPNEEKTYENQPAYQDVFGDEQDAEIKYKVLSWWCVPSLIVEYPSTNASS
jgi:hypothetical protein